MKQHPLSAVFPSLSPEEMAALAEDIKVNGLRSPIVMFEGMVLDGWNRYLACKEAKAMIREIEYRGIDPVGFVKSANWHRRHLNASQRASAAVALEKWRGEGRPKNSAPGAELGKSAAEIAKDAGTGTRTVEQAKKVHANGSESLKEAVKEGEISVKEAAEIAKKPKAEQDKALKQAKAPKEKTAKAESPEVLKLRERLEEVEEQRDALTETADALEKKLSAFETTEPDAQQKEIMRLQKQIVQLEGEVKRITRQRDDCQNKCNQLIREVKRLRGKQ